MEIPEPSRETTEDEKQASLSCSYSPDNRLRRSRSSASSTLGSRDRTRNGALCFFRWEGYWACLKDRAPSGAPVLALCPSPAPRRLLRTWLGAPKSRAAGPWFLQPYTRPSRGPHRSLTVVPSIWIEGTTVRLRGGSGGAPVGLWTYERAVGDATPPIPPTAMNLKPQVKCFNRRHLRT